MSAASRYWRMVKIDAAGKRTIEEVPSAKAFFLASFPEFMPQSEVPDALIQRQLLHWMREAPEQEADNTSKCCLSQLCLLCFISSQIERVCLQLEGHFGAEHGFTCGDLLRCVLDHDSSRFKRNATPTVSTSYQSLPQEILQNFSPEQSSLATWTTRLVKHHRELNTFLLEHGVYLVSDWAILNDTSPKQIQRIFSQFHQLTLFEIQQAKGLLESYHAVYRAQRLKQRQQGIKGQCLPPTREQLEQIAQRLFSQTGERFRRETVMAKLQEMASRLRDYRIYVRGGSLPTESMDAPTTKVDADRSLSRDFIDDRNTTDEQTEFLLSYRQQFVACLDGAIAKVTEEQARKLQQKDPQKAEKFLKALQLFHCQGKSMGEIAKAVNLQAQYHVTRLLQLKSFRADIQQQFLVLLRDRVIHEAKTFTDPERLQALELQIEEALNEQVNQLIQEAATEAATATGTKKQTTTSLFAERLCLYLDTRRSNHD